jgi:hypothetical protein
MRRSAFGLIGLVGLGCGGGGATEPIAPTAPSLQATVYYEAGGSAGVSGTGGTWCNWRTVDSSLHLLVLTAQATPARFGDSARPAVAFVSFSFRGRRFDELPTDFAQRLGASGADTVGSRAGTANVPYKGDSGTVRLRRLGSGYPRVDFNVWYSPAYVPVAPRFRIAGYTELASLPVCDLP